MTKIPIGTEEIEIVMAILYSAKAEITGPTAVQSMAVAAEFGSSNKFQGRLVFTDLPGAMTITLSGYQTAVAPTSESVADIKGDISYWSQPSSCSN